VKIKILFILLSLNFTLFSQNTETNVDTNKLWSNLHIITTFPLFKETNYIKFSEDTVIGSYHYKKVLNSTDSLQSVWSEVGYIRENQEKMVFYRTLNDTTNRLMYDFSAQIGDSLFVNIFHKLLVVESIDSVFIYNKYRKRITFNNDIWVEGIGSVLGVMNCGRSNISGAEYNLLCFWENDTLKYHNPDFSACYLSTVNIFNYSRGNIQISVYPNPVSSNSVLKIDNLNTPDNTIEIYSVLGQKVKTIVVDKQVIIRKSDFQRGLYIYKLITKSRLYTGKFEVE